MDGQGGSGSGWALPRRGFLAAGLAGVTSVVLAACTGGGGPQPTPTPTRSPSVTPTPTPTPLPPGVPEPTAMRRTKWAADPFARGAFSFDAIGTTAERREQLAQPVLDRVFFAGEAVSAIAPGTVHGALVSGRDVAELVGGIAEPGERIAIIGAGIAGLTAANELLGRRVGRPRRAAGDEGEAGADEPAESGEPDFEVVVIEARDRVGGRIHSVDDDAFGGSIELGALLLPADDALDTLLDEASVEVDDLAPPTDARTLAGAWTPIQPVGAEALAAARAWAETWPFDVGLSRALIGSGAAAQSTDPGEGGVSNADWLAYTLSSAVEPATGASPALVSARTFDADRTIAPAHLVRGRFRDVVDELAASVDVALSSVVTRIAYTADRVSLRMDTGESLRVDRVIVTVPLGVLQTDTVDFSPNLPRGHQQAIAVLGMGAVDLVWLRFDEAFWRADASDGAPPAQEVLTVVGGERTVAAWLDVGLADDEPVLVGVIAAEQARRLEQLNDDEFRAEVLADLVPFAPGDPTATGSPTPAPQ